jgi:hypothetical protein
LRLRLSKLAANILTDFIYSSCKPPQHYTVIREIAKEEFGKPVIALMT